MLIDSIMKVQKLNIEGVTSLRKKKSERKRRKEMRIKNNNVIFITRVCDAEMIIIENYF